MRPSSCGTVSVNTVVPITRTLILFVFDQLHQIFGRTTPSHQDAHPPQLISPRWISVVRVLMRWRFDAIDRQLRVMKTKGLMLSWLGWPSPLYHTMMDAFRTMFLRQEVISLWLVRKTFREGMRTPGTMPKVTICFVSMGQ
jgi:hypothetical protein